MLEPTNLGPRGIRHRVRLGVLGLTVAGIVLTVQVARDTPIVWTVGLAPILWLGGLGVFQAQAKT